MLTALAHVQHTQGMMAAYNQGGNRQQEAHNVDATELLAVDVSAAAQSAAVSFAHQHHRQLSGSDMSRIYTALKLLGGPSRAEQFMSALGVRA
jgi:hypothetical protein